MSKVEKIPIIVILAVLAASFSIYGVWQDKMTFLSLLIPLLYAALAVWVVGAYRSCGVLEYRSKETLPHPLTPSLPHIQTPPGGIMLLLFWLYSAAMIPFSVIPYEAKISVLRFGCYLGTYWAVANICSRFPARRAVWSVLLLALLGVALYSLVQHKIAPGELFGTERYIDRWDCDRLAGTYICPNHIAHLFLMWIPFCLVFPFIPQFGWFWRICFGYALPVFGLLIYRTQSRAGLLGTVAAASALMLLVMLRKSRKAFGVALVAAPLLMALTLGGLWVGSAAFRDRMQPVVKVASHCFAGEWEKAISTDGRPMMWADSLAMVKDRPFVGVGPGNYGQTYPEYRHRVLSNRVEMVHPHSEPIELITEYGLVGTALFIGALIAFCVSLIRLLKTSPRPYHALPAAALLAALAGTFVHGLFDFELRIFPNALMLSVLAGCAVAPLLRSQRSEVRDQKTDTELPVSDLRPPTSGPNGMASVLRSLISIMLLLAACWAIQSMSSAALRVQGDVLRLQKDRARAEKLYKIAAAIDPQNWEAYLGLGQIYSYYRYQEVDSEKKAAWAELERDTFVKAARHNTKKEEVTYGLGRAQLAAGDKEAGLDTLRRAAHYKRFNDFYWRKLGIELRKAGHYEEALEVFQYARKLHRGNATVDRNIKWLTDRLKGEG